MHRYPAGGGGSGVGNNTGGGVPRDTSRPDPGFPAPSSFPPTSRRPVPLTPYKLKCDQEPLNARLGPPDCYPPTPNCAEESLSRDACQNGYKETIDGVEESRETFLTLINERVWSKPLINRYKESIRKHLKALNNALVRKRKAGQVYGVPLSGPLLTRTGQFPEQRHCTEDNRKKWIEDLAQHKRLKVLADHVPHGLRRRTLFEALIKNEVPFLRATWCIKVMYLNQVRPLLSSGMSAGGGDKSQLKRIELWTKDALEYMQSLLDEVSQHGAAAFSSLARDNSALLPLAGSSQQGDDFTQSSLERDDPSLQKKWQYMSRLMQLHYAEGLLHRAQVVEWILKQIQEREALDASEWLLPLVLDLIEDISMCQTQVRTLVDVALQKLGELCPAGTLPDTSEHPRHCYVATFYGDLICYLLTAVPDSFVALDCFPLPSYMFDRRGNSHPALAARLNDGGEGIASVAGNQKQSNLVKPQGAHSARELAMKHLVDSVQKRASSLSKAVNPAILRKNEGSVIQKLDKALISGNILDAYDSVFDEDFCGYEQLPDEWLAGVSPWFKLSPLPSRNTSPPEVFAVRFLCEWAICDFRDCRRIPITSDRKSANVRALCRVYLAVSVLCMRMEEIERRKGQTSSCIGATGLRNLGFHTLGTGSQGSKQVQVQNVSSWTHEGIANSNTTSLSTFFESPGPVHDIIVAWLDQHELRKGEGFERLQLLLWELVNKGLFWPPAYVRQLIVSRVLENKETTADFERALRHWRLLQHLPLPPGLNTDECGKSTLDPVITEALRIYRNERRLALNGFDLHHAKHLRKEGEGLNQQLGQDFSKVPCTETSDLRFPLEFRNTDKMKRSQRKKMKVIELKQAIARCLHFPDWCMGDQVSSIVDTSTCQQAASKRQVLLHGNTLDRTDSKAGCEECSRNKKLKAYDGNSIFSQGPGMSPRDDDDMWWVKKLPKAIDATKTESATTVKPPKQPSRGRPKAVRKLSLAQLDAARIEGSQGASSSHTCDSKVHCPYHRSVLEGNMPSQNNVSKKVPLTPDLKSTGTALKRLRLGEKRSIAKWINDIVRHLVEGGAKVASASTTLQPPVGYGVSSGGSSVVDDRTSRPWQLGEEELATILYFLDIAADFQALIRLLLWLLPKAIIPTASPAGQSNKLIPSVSWKRESCVCEIGETTILTCLRRYEGVLTATNLLPEVLSAGMQRAAMVIMAVPVGRVACLPLFAYIRDLYKKYNALSSLQMWEKSWKMRSDQRMIVELEALKAGEGEGNFTLLGVASPGVGDDRDEPMPHRLMGRLIKIGPCMKDVVHRTFQDAINQMVSKERELSMSASLKEPGLERWDEGLQAAQYVVTGLLDCIKQHAVSAPHGDLQLAAAAVSAVVCNAGSAIAVVFESLTANNSYSGSTSSGMLSSVRCARRILQAHIHCIRLLKESFGDRQNRVLESALASEAASVVTNAIVHTSGRAPRPQFQLSPETPDPSSALAGDLGAGSNGLTLGRSATAAAAVAALVVGLVLNGIAGLEKIISLLLKNKEGLEAMHLFRSSGSNPNGMSRVVSGNALKNDMAEVHVFWFRVLIGDCRSVASRLVAEMLGESSLLAFMQMQRLLPLKTVLLPAYALFSTVLRGQQFSSIMGPNREDASFQQVICTALGDLLSHDPFREVCLQDTRELYPLLARDTGDLEYASLLDMKGADAFLKVSSMVPSRARLFLHAVLDRKVPSFAGDENYMQNLGSTKGHNSHVEELVQILDDLQPATFHWQWVEMRLLLNEQVFMEKLEAKNMSAEEAVKAATSAIEDGQSLSESEKNFTEIVLTRLLVRPDAAALYSEALRLLGRALEDYLILQVQWILENSDMLLGRKSLRQQLDEMAHRKTFKVGCRRVSVWGWLPPQGEDSNTLTDNDKKPEAASPEEGEVAEENVDSRKEGKLLGAGYLGPYDCGVLLKKHFAIEKALADLVLPCLARSSTETWSRFASRLVKQMSDLEQQVSLLSRSSGKPMIASSETHKGIGLRKGPRSGLECGSPGIGRRSVTSVADSSPPCAAALQTSLWLRLQFFLPLLCTIYADRDYTPRNMRSTLAPVLLRLLGNRVVQEGVEHFCSLQHDYLAPGRDLEWNAEAAAAAAAAAAGEGLFDRLLSVLHALLSSTWAVWLKQKSNKPLREVPLLDREIVQRMQADLDHMQLPLTVRLRLQAAMPILAPPSTLTISAGPPQVPAAVFPVLQTSVFSANSLSTGGPTTASHKVPFRLENSLGKGKPTSNQESDVEIDPWTLLEDGTGSGCTGGGNGGLAGGESGTTKACAWLKGAVRVRRTDLTYVGSVDDDF